MEGEYCAEQTLQVLWKLHIVSLKFHIFNGSSMGGTSFSQLFMSVIRCTLREGDCLNSASMRGQIDEVKQLISDGGQYGMARTPSCKIRIFY